MANPPTASGVGSASSQSTAEMASSGGVAADSEQSQHQIGAVHLQPNSHAQLSLSTLSALIPGPAGMLSAAVGIQQVRPSVHSSGGVKIGILGRMSWNWRRLKGGRGMGKKMIQSVGMGLGGN